MGCFSVTCAVSGLGIQAGCPVRVLFLNQNPYTDERGCSSTAYWAPRSLPFRARYNDYGGIDDILPEDQPLVAATLAGFERDILIKGWGDNSVHDVPTGPGMTLPALLNACWSMRLKVGRVRSEDPAWDKHFARMTREKTPKGVPTKKRLDKLVAPVMAAYEGYRQVGKEAGYLIRRKGYGLYTIRSHYTSGDEKADLVKLQQVLAPHYATMLTAGVGNYASQAELWVAAKPAGPTKHLRIGHRRLSDPPIHVQYAMIREDVWQALMAGELPSAGYGPDKVTSLGPYIEDMTRYLAERRRAKAYRESNPSDIDALLAEAERRNGGRGPASAHYREDVFPFRMGLATALDILLATTTSEQDEALARLTAEMAVAEHWMFFARRQWTPVSSHGPQSPEWDSELAFHQRITTVLTKLDADYRRDYGREEDE